MVTQGIGVPGLGVRVGVGVPGVLGVRVGIGVAIGVGVVLWAYQLFETDHLQGI